MQVLTEERQQAERTDAVGVDVLLGIQMADGPLDVLSSLQGGLQKAKFALARALVAVAGKDGEAALGQPPGVEAGSLLLNRPTGGRSPSWAVADRHG